MGKCTNAWCLTKRLTLLGVFPLPCVSFVVRIEVLTILEKYPPAVSTKCKSISLKVTHNPRPLRPSVPILGLSKFDIFVVVVTISLASFTSLVPVVFIILVYYFFQTDYLWSTCSSFQTRKRKTKRKKHDFQIPTIVVTEVPWLFKDKKLQDFYPQW